MYRTEHWKKVLKEELSEKRYHHSLNVAAAAKELAALNGYDEEKAYFAGLLHDMCKEKPPEKQKQWAEKSGYYIDPAELCSEKLWHGIAAAYVLKEKHDIKDEDILNSIRFHTVARGEMSLLEEIIYVADFISADRKMTCVHAVRALAKEDLKLAVLAELQFSIKSTIDKGGSIPLSTFEAYNRYIKYHIEK